MNSFSRNSLIGAFALVASLSAPMAFAQSSAEASAQSAPPTEAAAQVEANAPAATTAPAPAAAAPAKMSWSDVDLDKDGKLTKSEAATVPALGQVFDQADGNADGTLTTDEYKAYVAKVQGAATTSNDG